MKSPDHPTTGTGTVAGHLSLLERSKPLPIINNKKEATIVFLLGIIITLILRRYGR